MELLVAMAVFLVVGGAAVSLFRRHVPLFTQQQSQTTVNIALRNAAAQLQIDLVNAGAGYYQGTNIPTWPLGITVEPGTGNCYNPQNRSYGSGCFDSLTIISIDPNTPPAHPSDIGSNCVSSTSSTLFANPLGATTLANLAAAYKPGDEVLLLKSDGSQMAVAVLSKAGQVTGGKVQLQHNPNGTFSNVVTKQSYPDDYYNIANATNNTKYNQLGTQFCPTDWILKISGTTYGVDASNPYDPVLVRSLNNGKPQFVADQIIGFRVGAFAANPSNPACDTFDWYYDTSCYDFNTVQGVRLSILGRTNPETGFAAGFHNSFDGGPYKIEGVSVVVNPRNLSMNN